MYEFDFLKLKLCHLQCLNVFLYHSLFCQSFLEFFIYHFKTVDAFIVVWVNYPPLFTPHVVSVCGASNKHARYVCTAR